MMRQRNAQPIRQVPPPTSAIGGLPAVWASFHRCDDAELPVARRDYCVSPGVLLLLALIVATLPTSGCRPGPPEHGTPGTTAPGSLDPTTGVPDRETLGGVMPAERDTLLMTYSNDPSTLNPILANDTVSSAFQRQVYESLGQGDYSDPDAILPALAESWEFDEETLTFTIHLRKGVKWHPMRLPGGKLLDGYEVTSRDVKFSFDCVLNPHVEAAHLRSYFEDPDAEVAADRYKIKVRAIDDYTIEVQWTKPYFLADQVTLGFVPIIPRHVYSVDKNGEPISFDFGSREFASGFNTHWANNKMCGTGPMMFKDWVRNNRLELTRFNDYWGEPFYFSRILMQCIPNTNTVTQKVLQRELDWAGIPEKDQWLQSRDSPNVTSGKVKLVDFDYPGYRYIGYNLKRPLFEDKRVRWALAHGTPVQEIIDNVFHGLAIRVAGPFLPGSKTADDSVKPVKYDPQRAKELLEEAGWSDSDNDGVRDKLIGGVRVPAFFDLMIYTDSQAFKTIAENYQAAMAKIGVRVQISPAEWALMTERLNKKEFDAVLIGWASGWSKTDPFQIWHGSLADVPASSNAIGYDNPEVNRLISELRVTMDEPKQYELYHKIFRQIHDDQPYTFLFSEKATAGYDARIQNVQFYRVRPGVDTREWYADRPRLLGE